jgi:hypothetical protein
MQKMLHNLQIKLEVYHLDNSEYPRGTFLSYREAEMVQLASLLDVDPNDLYPCGKFGQDGSCSSWYVYDSLMYQEPRPDPKCWKNHYVITYFILNPTAPFEPPQDYPCGSYSLLGDDIPDFCTDGIEEDWEQWFCDDSWARNFNLIIK